MSGKGRLSKHGQKSFIKNHVLWQTRGSLDLALIGNGSYQALIDSEARVQWLCWPRFDSSFVVGPLLDSDKGGEFSVMPTATDFKAKQSYVKDTAIVETIWSRAGESFSVTDFAPRFVDAKGVLQRPRRFVRRLRVIEGAPQVRCLMRAVSDYGRSQTAPESVLFEQSQPIESGKEFTLDEDLYLVLSWEAPVGAELAARCEEELASTALYWRGWCEELTLPNQYTEQVLRSAITLKLHQYDDSGALSAAATTSIPEHAGSGRNWDYRLCWPRDSYFSVDALSKLGSLEESRLFVDFLLRVAAEGKEFQPIYGLAGETELEEEVLEHLAGYQGDGPVRIGNQAYVQKQHDIYGEMICAIEPVYLDAPRPELRALLFRLLEAIESNFKDPDAGLWEKRQEPARHSFSLLMHWMGSRAAQRMGLALDDNPMASRANELEEAARRCLDEACWNEAGAFYAETVSGSQADASLLFLLSVGYLPPDHPRAEAHLDALAKRLQGPEGLFRRYLHDDGLGETCVSFTVCTLWYAEALACLGNLSEARTVLEAVLARCNHVGLLSEDIDPKDGSLWGNFPQTYSHVGIIRCALALGRDVAA